MLTKSVSTDGADSDKPSLLIGIWRWYAPATFRSVGDDSDLISELTVARLLKETGYQSVEELTQDLSAHKRGEIPKVLQNRITSIFEVDTSFLDDDLEFLLRPIEIACDGDWIRGPYPLIPSQPVTASLSLAAFRIVSSRGSSKKVTMRVGVSTNEFLSPKGRDDEDFCRLLFVDTVELKDTLIDSHVDVVRN